MEGCIVQGGKQLLLNLKEKGHDMTWREGQAQQSLNTPEPGSLGRDLLRVVPAAVALIGAAAGSGGQDSTFHARHENAFTLSHWKLASPQGVEHRRSAWARACRAESHPERKP